MASEDTEALIDTLNILNAQQQMAAAGADTGNPRTKGVVVDKKAGSKARAVSPTLTSNEKSRYQSIFKILKDIIDPGPEAGKSTATSRVKKEGNVSSAAKEATGNNTAEKEGKSFIDKLLGGLALLPFIKMLWGYLKKQIPKLLKRLKDVAKRAFRAAFKAAKKVLSSIGRAALKAFRNAGAAIGKVFDKIKNSKVVTSLKSAFGSAFSRLKDVFNGVKNSVMKQASKLKNAIAPGAKAVASKAGSFFGGVLDKGKNLVSKGVRGIKYVGGQAVKGAKAVGGAIVNVGKSAAKSAVGKAVKGLVGKGAGGLLKFLGGAARRIPILGPIIEGLFAAHDIKKLKEQYANGELTEEELHQQVGRRAITGVGGAVGAGAGAILAGLLTSWTGPGAIVGAIAGGVLGDIAGRFLSGLFTDYIMPPEYTKSIGKFFTGKKPPAPAGGMVKVNDGVIMHGGQTVRINSKDDVLALKTGGPLDKLMKPSTLDIGSAQVFDDMRELGKAQLQTLVAIKNGINALVRNSTKPSGSSSSEIVQEPNRVTNDYFKSITA